MDAAAWIALAGAVGTLAVNAGTYLIAWGALRSTVAALALRVSALENEIDALTQLKVDVAEVKTSLGFMLEQLKDLNAAIRWMREPAAGRPPRLG